MNKLIEQIEKMKPFFEKFYRNTYLRAIRDGFVATMPIVLFSSIFLLIVAVPSIFGFKWSEDVSALLIKPFTYTMGFLAVLVAGTTAKSLTDSFNTELESTNQINYISTMIASVTGFLLLAADSVEGGFSNAYLGTQGLLTAFLVAFVTGNVYRFCIKNNVTIRMPEEVPPNISQVFKDVIPFGLTILILYALDLGVRNVFDANVPAAVGKILAPLFSATDGYLGLAIAFGAYAFFWFVGIHGPSVVEPLIIAISYANIEENIQMVQNGMHAVKILNPVTQTFVVTMGGTGATLVVPFMFMWLCKSKRNKVIGRASVIPTFFGVNEPILFGGPLVLNPLFFIPFVAAPIVNVWILKFFVDVLGMNSFSIILPWTTPAPLGIVMGTRFAPLSFVLAILLVVVDVLIYYPFVKVYDKQILAEEAAGEVNVGISDRVAANFNTKKAEAILETATDQKTITEQTNVLVLCAGGGTSGLLANALTKAAKDYNVPVTAAAGSYGSHREILPQYQLVVLAPQVASNYEDIKLETDKLGIKLVKTEGMEYIALTRDGQGALDFVKKQLEEG